MIIKRSAKDRGLTDLGWLHSRHTFSFGNYYDPNHMGFRSLRVINDDVVEPGKGFATHSHQDAEIFSYVIEGELEHKDNFGNGYIIQAGEFQYMSAGRGVRHSEFNPSSKNRVHFLQVWLKPNQSGGEPRYAQKKIERTPNTLSLLFSDQPQGVAVAIRQNANIYFGNYEANQAFTFSINPKHGVWIQVIQGEMECLGEILKTDDGASIAEISEFKIEIKTQSQFLLFELASP
jgi:hypothetical protein